MIKTLVLSAAALAAVPAAAKDAAAPKVLVPYADLDLASANGAAALETRVKRAARKVCGVTQAPGFREANYVRLCRARALSAARPQMTAALGRGGSATVAVAASR